MKRSLLFKFFLLTLALAIAACASPLINDKEQNPQGTIAGPGGVFDVGIVGTPHQFKEAKAAIKEAKLQGCDVSKAEATYEKAWKIYNKKWPDDALPLAEKAKKEAMDACPGKAMAAPAAAGMMAPMAEKIVLRGVNFDFNKADIKPAFAPILDEAVAALKANPSVNVVIEGHTDSTGPEAYNKALSAKRADAVKSYLVSKGISAARLSTVALGESQPIADNKTAEGRRMNRRVELKVQ